MHSSKARVLRLLLVGAAVCAVAATADLHAQVMERVTFDEAVRRALVNNPRVEAAAADVVRARAVEQQVRAQSLPTVDALVTSNVIDPITRFSGSAIIPRTQVVTSADILVPLIVPVRWAERTQAADQVVVSERSAEDVRRQVADSAAEAYLSIIALQRVVELNERARDTARAHYEYANQRFLGGIGSRLNAVRAEQDLSANEARVEEARLAVRRAQETLGVIIAADGPVDVSGEPIFEVPPAAVPDSDFVFDREDVRVMQAREAAAQRRVADAWKDYLPSFTALFAPEMIAPAGLFANSRSWRAAFLFAVPVFDGGQRRGQTRERVAQLDVVRSERTQTERQASAEIRTAREAIASTERALAYAQQSAAQANEVVRITDIAFREGATTNIELIDAQRQARDADTQVAVAAYLVQRARLELLVATGQFPQ